MTEPRTSRRVARVVLLVLILGLVAVAFLTGPAVWEWAAYGEWKPIWKSHLDLASGTLPGSGQPNVRLKEFIIGQSNALPPDALSLNSLPEVLRDSQPLDAGMYSYLKAKRKHLRWLPGKDLLIRQIGKEGFHNLFPNPPSSRPRYLVALEYLNGELIRFRELLSDQDMQTIRPPSWWVKEYETRK